ncbi:hypothetical protein [Entomospira culicis]|uniref:Uncharacterized protein n=1 Tax=Entomospira culicis TaxID=2719989 RepID=A0A968KUJ5_9SPIO|nr:hypothetical protein [Entomospira culicis]NIZ19461.1 hypothetical protein [Entomospira culicis]NIZ69634.1 hypothetical protein [Entomospira culicis]WDI36745.1 hypothetical protein PVA46_05310 [Entomospira culicis]WDI38374.1 hypothetical protein PVA47_05320 [Entomospira culicis]
MNIMLITSTIFLVSGVTLFTVRLVLFFKVKDYTEEMANEAAGLLRLGMVMVGSSISGMVGDRIGMDTFPIITMMLVTGLILFVLLLIFTAQLSRMLSVWAIRNDLQKIHEEDEATKVIIVDDAKDPR